jgi:hypothetical protein
VAQTFKTTTLSEKSASFNEPPSKVCSVVSRKAGGKGTKAPGGAGAAFVGGALVIRLAGPVPLVVTSLELQLERPRAPIKPTPTSVSTTRPGVQNDFQPVRLSEEDFDKAM